MKEKQQPEIPFPFRLSHGQKLLFPSNAGFTTVMIDEGEEWLWKRDSCVNHRGMLNASQVKAIFKRLVDKAIGEKKHLR